jgi:hypothetical protein
VPGLAQEEIEFGELSYDEKEFTKYEKDTMASAVYLTETGDNFFEVRDNYIYLITKYKAKIKILKKDGFNQADISIPYYHSDKKTEKIDRIRAVTHNGSVVRGVRKEEVFDVDVSENWSEKKFTFPDVKVGSILEYTYEIQSPFHFNLKGWEFQSEIPKLYSEYTAKIPSNWVYNRALIGELKLTTNDATLKKYCFKVPGFTEASCEVLKYAMKDVPAFKASEEFMLSGNNYRSRLEFELSEYTSFYEGKERFTKSWDDVDREFKSDKDLGRQLRKNGFFEKHIDAKLLSSGEPLTRANNIYDFVRKYFTWNEEYGIWNDNRVENAFANKKGNAAEINLTLINLMNLAGIKADMMLLGTRDKGLPKKSHPVMTDFNYIVAKVDIEGQSYLLDATDKNLPFGMLPFHSLNYYGRVMDFKNDSYWYDIVPENENKRIVRAQLEFDGGTEKIKGMFDIINLGYSCVSQRNMHDSMTKDEYLEKSENEIAWESQITSYELKEKYSSDKKLTERFEFESRLFDNKNNLFLNPFFVTFFNENPFISMERTYPIDFGYLRNFEFMLNLKIPDGYSIKTLPESKNIVLPENLGFLRLDSQNGTNGIINVFFELKLNATQYSSDYYSSVKDLFAKAVQAQTQSLIVLEKI